MDDHSPKLCECGCGKPAPLMTFTDGSIGYKKGQPLRFIKGHNGRGQPGPNRGKVFTPIAERLWSKVDVRGPDECWEWQGASQQKGHGVIRVGDRNVMTHRLAYELTNGPIPSGQMIRHTCDNPPCCNPAHLIPGTHLDNTADMVSRERQERGQRHHNARLSDVDVIEIRRLANAGIPHREIAKQFGIHRQYVSSLKRGKSWKHLTT